MTSTTQERPLIVKADRERLFEAMQETFNALEELSWRVDTDAPVEGETRRVEYQHIAELTILLNDLDVELAEFADFRERLEAQRRYLAYAFAEQEGRDVAKGDDA